MVKITKKIMPGGGGKIGQYTQMKRDYLAKYCAKSLKMLI